MCYCIGKNNKNSTANMFGCEGSIVLCRPHLVLYRDVVVVVANSMLMLLSLLFFLLCFLDFRQFPRFFPVRHRATKIASLVASMTAAAAAAAAAAVEHTYKYIM